jgi:CRP/FNR family cyclic AMP-dependent transcriptional regulator
MATNLIQNVYLFKGLSDQELEQTSEIVESEAYPAGDDVFNETDPAQALYIIRHGSVRIHQKSDSGENIEDTP